MTDDQVVGFAFLGGMVAVPFVGPWLKAAVDYWRRPYNTDTRTVRRMLDETSRQEWND